MKKYFILFLIMPISLQCFSQKTIRVGKYNTPITGMEDERSLIIEMPFGKADIINVSGDTANLKNAGDMDVDIVCTDYPSNLSLQELNQKRLFNFLKKFPFIKSNQLIQVNLFRQTDGAEKEKAEIMFHGLVIRYRPEQSAETMKADLSNLEVLLKPVETISLQEQDKLPEKKPLLIQHGRLYDSLPSRVYVLTYDTLKLWPEDSIAFMTPKEALDKELITKETYNNYKKTEKIVLSFRIKLSPDISYEAVPFAEITATDSSISTEQYHLPDSTLFKIFARTKWRDAVIVGDVTGSMYPYTAQLLLWIKLHGIDSFTTRFVFFNDGDDTPDDKKKPGATGGIYLKTCKSFNEVKDLVIETMHKGGGGDSPENDVEALLKAEKQFPESDFQVLIADNWAPVKDRFLIKKLVKPVRIILCGTSEININVDYLNLAMQTKGSVHLIDQDLYDLALMHDGETLKIGTKTYKKQNGNFVDEESRRF